MNFIVTFVASAYLTTLLRISWIIRNMLMRIFSGSDILLKPVLDIAS